MKELRDGADAASGREAQTLEAVLNLRTGQNRVSAWMEHVQREISISRSSATASAEALRDLGTEIEAAKAARAASREELALIEARLGEVLRSIEKHPAERQQLAQLGLTVDGLRREMRASFEASAHAHNRLRDFVEQRQRDTGASAHEAGTSGGAQPMSGATDAALAAAPRLSFRWEQPAAEVFSPAAAITPARTFRIGAIGSEVSPATARMSLAPYEPPASGSARAEPRYLASSP